MTEPTRTGTAPILESGSKDGVYRVEIKNFGSPIAFVVKGESIVAQMIPSTNVEGAERIVAALNSYSPEREALLAQLVEALTAIQTEAEFVADAKAPFSTWVAERARAALTEYETQKHLPK